VRGAAWFAGGALVGAVGAGGTPAAWADFRQTSVSSAQLAADVLRPPSDLTAADGGCGPLGTQLDLAWTASPTSWSRRYDVLLSTTSGGPYTVVPPQNGQDPTRTRRTVGGLERKRTYYVTVRSVRGRWWTSTGQVAVRTRARRC